LYVLLYETGVLVPTEKSPPFLIAAFLGKGKPVFEFWDDFMADIKKLSPFMPEDQGVERRICLVEVLCVICDSPVRFWLTGQPSNIARNQSS
jgi:hypothetical protein